MGLQRHPPMLYFPLATERVWGKIFKSFIKFSKSPSFSSFQVVLILKYLNDSFWKDYGGLCHRPCLIFFPNCEILMY